MIDVRFQITNGYSGRYTLDPGRVIGIAIHHTVSGGDFADDIPDSQEAEITHLQAIDLYHLSQNPTWGGFGYHFAIFSSGRLYYCGSITGARAHVASRNHELIGIAFVGNFTDRQPAWGAILAGQEAIAFVRSTYGPLPVHGHSYWALPQYPTACPGDTWPQWLPELEASPPPPAEEEHMKLTVIKGDQSPQQAVLGRNGLKTVIVDEAHRAALEAIGVIAPGEYLTLPQAQYAAIPDYP